MPDYYNMEDPNMYMQYPYWDEADIAQRGIFGDQRRRDCRDEFQRGFRLGFRQGFEQGRRQCFFPGFPRR